MDSVANSLPKQIESFDCGTFIPGTVVAYNLQHPFSGETIARRTVAQTERVRGIDHDRRFLAQPARRLPRPVPDPVERRRSVG
jgi:hypothetical protein